MNGFYIKKLKIVGDNKEDADVVFEKGLNVIHGPSNTGKSYIFQCIDYALGASKIKKISESNGYSKLYMEIRDIDDNTPITILRFLNSNEIFYYFCSIDKIDNKQPFGKLKSKHDPENNDNISKFLLNQIGITENKYLIKNKDGKKVTLSFRAIAHLSIISETDIISEEKSPVLETQSTQQTYSKSVFRYLLTNKDDIACAELEKAEIRKARNDAKIDYIKEEIISLTEEKEKLCQSRNSSYADDDYSLNYYKDKIIEMEDIIKIKRKELHDINSENNRLNLQKNKVEMMLNKFQLLKNQYLSDVDRLEFLSLGDELLSQIETHRCPLCDSKVMKDVDNEINDEIANCYNNETLKIKFNINELEISIDDLENELLQLNKMLLLGEEKTKEYIEEISQISTKDLKPLKVIIKLLIEQASIETKISDIESTILHKQGEIITFEESKKIKGTPVTEGLAINNQVYKDLCEIIKKCLIDCGYAEVKEVVFDVKSQDIVIDGVHRLSNGKGFRAFFYAVFSAALMIYLNKVSHVFSNVLVLDSPLTTLKEYELDNKQDDDFIDNSLQDGLFTFFAENFKDKQVIIIDNKQPPKSLSGKYHEITFTRSQNTGRYGLFKK